jgi:hypothetical protein
MRLFDVEVDDRKRHTLSVAKMDDEDDRWMSRNVGVHLP